jgi:hypothetical protein
MFLIDTRATSQRWSQWELLLYHTLGRKHLCSGRMHEWYSDLLVSHIGREACGQNGNLSKSEYGTTLSFI